MCCEHFNCYIVKLLVREYTAICAALSHLHWHQFQTKLILDQVITIHERVRISLRLTDVTDQGMTSQPAS